MLLGLCNSKLKVILKSSGGRNMERLVSERVWPGYSGVNMGKGIPDKGRLKKCSVCLMHADLPLSLVKYSKR